MKTEETRLTIVTDADFRYKVRVRAAILNLNITNYIKQLVEKDLAEADREQPEQKEK